MDAREVARELADRNILDLDRTLREVIGTAGGGGEIDPGSTVSDNVVAWEDYVLITSGKAADLREVAARPQARDLARTLSEAGVINLERPLSDILSLKAVGSIDPGSPVSDNVVAWEDYVLITSGRLSQESLPTADRVEGASDLGRRIIPG